MPLKIKFTKDDDERILPYCEEEDAEKFYFQQILTARFRTCPHRVNVRIIRHNFVGDKAKIRRRAVALQGFLTQSPAKFDEKTCMNPYVDRF